MAPLIATRTFTQTDPSIFSFPGEYTLTFPFIGATYELPSELPLLFCRLLVLMKKGKALRTGNASSVRKGKVGQLLVYAALAVAKH